MGRRGNCTWAELVVSLRAKGQRNTPESIATRANKVAAPHRNPRETPSPAVTSAAGDGGGWRLCVWESGRVGGGRRGKRAADGNLSVPAPGNNFYGNWADSCSATTRASTQTSRTAVQACSIVCMCAPASFLLPTSRGSLVAGLEPYLSRTFESGRRGVQPSTRPEEGLWLRKGVMRSGGKRFKQ